MTSRIRVALIALVVFLGVSSVSMSADSFVVVHDRYSDDSSFVAHHMCSFPVLISNSSNINDALFFDETGQLVRVLSTVNHAKITFSANDVSLTAIGSGGIEYTLNPDGSVGVHTFGINLLLTLPGYGAVTLDAGSATYVFDPDLQELFHAGPVRYDNELLCAALSGN